MAAEVVEIERPQLLGDLAPPGVGQVVEVAAHGEDVELGLLGLAGLDLRGGQDLQQLPEEADVDVAERVMHRELVQLLGRQSVEGIGLGHRAAEITRRTPAGGPRDALSRAGRALDRARELDARADAELAVDVAQVRLDRARAEDELLRDLAVRAAGGDERDRPEVSGPATDDYLAALAETRPTLTTEIVDDFTEDIEAIARL